MIGEPLTDPRFGALLESAPDGIVVVDPSGGIVLANRAAEAMFGFAGGELVGRGVDELVPEGRRAGHAALRAGYDRDPQTRPMDVGLDLSGRRCDGAEFPVEISLSPLPGADAGLVIAVIRDVTERRALESERLELARAQVARSEAAAEARRLNGVQSVTDAALAAVSLDAQMDAMLEPVRAALAAQCVSIRLRGRADGVGTGEPGARYSVSSPLRLRGERIGEVSAGRGDAPFGVEEEAMLDRIAERIALAVGQGRAYETTRAAEARLRDILGDVAGIVWEADEPDRRRFSFVSDGAQSLLGHPTSAWTGQDGLWMEMLDPADRAATLQRARTEVGAARDHELEYRVRAADGRTVWLRDRVRIARAPSGAVRMHGLMIDVTERRELEERLMHAQKMQAVGQLAGGIAHDFNNMLTAIIGYSNLLAARLAEEQDRGDLAQIERAAKRAQALTEQLLSFSRRCEPTSELVDLNELVAGVEPMLSRLIDEDIELVVSLAEHALLVEADRAQLEQVLVNLVINARDAMSGNGRIVVELDRRAGSGIVRVIDSGEGMPPEVQSRVFEPFFTTKPQGEGTGLGLATVYGIVDHAGGRIEIESELGTGTVVTVVLPVAETDDVGNGTEGGVVLVVEDELALRQLVTRVLEREGLRVVSARNGREALDLLQRLGGQIRLLLTDVVMPEMGGPELVAHVAARWPHISVIYSSGYTDSCLAGRGVNQDAVELLRKPYTIEQLRERVAQSLAG